MGKLPDCLDARELRPLFIEQRFLHGLRGGGRRFLASLVPMPCALSSEKFHFFLLIIQLMIPVRVPLSRLYFAG